MEAQKIEILYKNNDFAAVIKPSGVLSEAGDGGMVSLLEKQLSKKVYPVHRLDRGVGGVMVYALSTEGAAALSKIMENGGFSKEYLAVVHGKCPAEGTMEDLLFKDSKLNKSFVVKKERRGVKKASLEYKNMGFDGEKSIVRIKLHTGRSHQIRVQFSSRRMPLYGDGKYGGSDNCPIALWSFRIAFCMKNEDFVFGKEPPEVFPFSGFRHNNL